jgi:hypothetical protein
MQRIIVNSPLVKDCAAERQQAVRAGAIATPTVLIVSPHFPPSTLAGVHRARHLAKHLPSHGWRPIVIRADEATYTEAADPSLATLVPPTVDQIRTAAIPAGLARLAGIGDIGLRAYHALAVAVEKAVKLYVPEAVIITGSPFYPMLLSGRISKKMRVPVVLDFQDPWISETGHLRPRWSKGGLAHRLSLALEPRALRDASWVTSVSENHNEQLRRHHPWLNPSRMTAIPIGGDPEDFDAMRSKTPAYPAVRLERDRINLCYVGTFLPRAGSVVGALFKAVAYVRRHYPDLGSRLRLVFVGTSNQPMGPSSAAAPHRVLPFAEEAGVADLVHEHPARVSFIEALHLQSNAHGLLLLGSDEHHYTASKIYPAMMSGTPFLSIFHSASSSHEILSRAGGGATFAFSDIVQLDSMIPAIANELVKLARSPGAWGHVDPKAYAQYTAHAVAGQFADVLTSLTSKALREI